MLTNSSNSLFTYFPYQSFSKISDPLFSPVFNPDTSSVSSELNEICNGDQFCLYDGLVTGSLSLPAITRATVDEASRIVELSVKGEHKY